MKTLLAIILCALALGCTQQPISIPPTGKVIYEPIGVWRYVEWNNHTYITWQNGYQGGLEHDPDCHCHNVMEALSKVGK